jgi:hypothetical protein
LFCCAPRLAQTIINAQDARLYQQPHARSVHYGAGIV